jgi:hypothetical protein
MKRISIIICLLAAIGGQAQEYRDTSESIGLDWVDDLTLRSLIPALSTDRPSMSAGTASVPMGFLQYEGGLQASKTKELYAPYYSIQRSQIEEVLRFGINSKLEARAVINANSQYISSTGIVGPRRLNGVDPITVGIKYNFYQNYKRRGLNMSWLSHLSFPYLAYGDYLVPTQANMIFHEQRLILGAQLTNQLSITSNVGVSGATVGQGGFIDHALVTALLNLSLNEKNAVFVEGYTSYRIQGCYAYPASWASFGWTYAMREDLQLDVYGGYNASRLLHQSLAAQGVFLGAGVSYRYPLAFKLKNL